MVLFFIALIVFGILMGLIGIGAEEGGLVAFGIPFLAAGIFFGIRFAMHVANREHFKALHELVAEGWQIKSSDIHYQSNKVNIDCLAFPMHKLRGKYEVTVPRSKADGGGWNILDAKTTEIGVKEFCPKS